MFRSASGLVAGAAAMQKLGTYLRGDRIERLQQQLLSMAAELEGSATARKMVEGPLRRRLQPRKPARRPPLSPLSPLPPLPPQRRRRHLTQAQHAGRR